MSSYPLCVLVAVGARIADAPTPLLRMKAVVTFVFSLYQGLLVRACVRVCACVRVHAAAHTPLWAYGRETRIRSP
jgi:hypothetical protein